MFRFLSLFFLTTLSSTMALAVIDAKDLANTEWRESYGKAKLEISHNLSWKYEYKDANGSVFRMEGEYVITTEDYRGGTLVILNKEGKFFAGFGTKDKTLKYTTNLQIDDVILTQGPKVVPPRP